MPARTWRPSLTTALDQDVLPIVQKLMDDNESGQTLRVSVIYQSIQRSNSSLKRRPRRALEDSIERVLDVVREDQKGEKGDDTAGIEDDFEGTEVAIPEPKHDMNSAFRKIYAAQTNGGPPSESRSEGKKSKRRSDEPVAKRRKVEDRSSPVHISLDDLGGIDSIMEQLQDLIVRQLLNPETYLASGMKPPRGVLLHGPPGCGKTAFASAFAAELPVAFIPISAPSIVSGMSGESEKALREHFEEAKKLAPSIIFIDEIDSITPKREIAQREMEKRIVAQLLTCMDDLALEKTGGKAVVVIAATNRPNSIDPALRRGGRFDKEINMPVPNQDVRHEILKAMTRKMQVASDLDLEMLAKRTAGYVGADLELLVNSASELALKRNDQLLMRQETESEMQVDESDGHYTEDAATSSRNRLPLAKLRQFVQRLRDQPGVAARVEVSRRDFEEALPHIQPSSKREGFATVPDTTWADVGALGSIREELIDVVVQPILDPKSHKAVGLTAPGGVLLWGPPGCGKTLLAKAVANESKANFISVKGPELLSMYVGESERSVREVFTRARSSVPCIIFFDEVDALVPKRGGDRSESSARVVNALLTEMDGLTSREGIFVMAATNRPDVLDPAIMRPGRLETLLYVDLPAKDERVEILETLARNRNIDFSPEVAAIARQCEGFSGADLQALLTNAGRKALKRRANKISLADWEYAKEKVRPSVGKRARKEYGELEKRLSNIID